MWRWLEYGPQKMIEAEKQYRAMEGVLAEHKEAIFDVNFDLAAEAVSMSQVTAELEVNHSQYSWGPSDLEELLPKVDLFEASGLLY